MAAGLAGAHISPLSLPVLGKAPAYLVLQFLAEYIKGFLIDEAVPGRANSAPIWQLHSVNVSTLLHPTGKVTKVVPNHQRYNTCR